MDNTTIAVKREVVEKMKELGNKGETYSNIILKLIEVAREKQLHYLLMDETNTVSIDEALSNAKKRWQIQYP